MALSFILHNTLDCCISFLILYSWVLCCITGVRLPCLDYYAILRAFIIVFTYFNIKIYLISEIKCENSILLTVLNLQKNK